MATIGYHTYEQAVKIFDLRVKEMEKNVQKLKEEIINKNMNDLKSDNKDQHSAGVKLDGDKPRLDLVLGAFGKALIEVGKVGTFGAKKYTDNGWLEVVNARERYRSAELRHYFYEAQGELDDPESGILHAAHKAWNALADLELLLREREPKKGPDIRPLKAVDYEYGG